LKSFPDIQAYIDEVTLRAREASLQLLNCTTDRKNRALEAMAARIEERRGHLFAENRKDLEAARKANLPAAAVDRLTVSDKTVEAMARGLREVAALPDPVGEVLEEWRPPVGVTVRKIRQPIGVILVIYESRPNVTADAAGLCLKSGNACILRGGKEAIHTSLAIAECLTDGLRTSQMPEAAIQVIETTDRAVVGALL
jgi:glutamate-5-semialdehyde dehydrogenase